MIRLEITFTRKRYAAWGLQPIYRTEMRWRYVRWSGRALYLRWLSIAILRRDPVEYRHELFDACKALRASVMYRDDPKLCDWADQVIAAAEDRL